MILTPDELEELLNLAIENEQIERELMMASLNNEPETDRVLLINLLQNGLCRASNLARKEKGLPPIREENREKKP